MADRDQLKDWAEFGRTFISTPIATAVSLQRLRGGEMSKYMPTPWIVQKEVPLTDTTMMTIDGYPE